jgi:hypothetical protein
MNSSSRSTSRSTASRASFGRLGRRGSVRLRNRNSSGAPRARCAARAMKNSYSVPLSKNPPSGRGCRFGSSGDPRRDHRMHTNTPKPSMGGMFSW